MQLLPVKEHISENNDFTDHPLCQDTIYHNIDFYKKVGFNPPWVCYYVRKDDKLVGVAAFKGAPLNGQVEIAYGTFDQYQHQGIGAMICKMLVELSIKTDPSVRITARTLPEENYSTKILKKNGFTYSGVVNDPDDGDVWEWVYLRTSNP